MPMTNVAVSGVTRPTANRKSEPRGVACTAFIEKLGGACMQRYLRRRRGPVARWVQMAALGATICNVFKWVGGSVTSVSKPYGA